MIKEMSVHLAMGNDETAAYLICDTGCQKMVGGTPWLDRRILEISPLTVLETPERHGFRFGAAAPSPSLGRVRLVSGIAGHLGELRISRVADDIPGLLSQMAMVLLRMIINVHQGIIYVGAFDQTIPMFLLSNGHLAIKQSLRNTLGHYDMSHTVAMYQVHSEDVS